MYFYSVEQAALERQQPPSKETWREKKVFRSFLILADNLRGSLTNN